MDLSKFASNKKILSGVVGLGFIWEFIRKWNGMIIREWKGIEQNEMYLSKGKE